MFNLVSSLLLFITPLVGGVQISDYDISGVTSELEIFYRVIQLAVAATGGAGFGLIVQNMACVDSIVRLANSEYLPLELSFRPTLPSRVKAFLGFSQLELLDILQEIKFRDPLIYYLVMSNSTREAETIVEHLWNKHRLYNAYAVVADTVYTYDLLTERPVKIDPNGGLSKEVKDWKGKIFKSVVFARAPSMVPDDRTQLGYGGDDAEVLATLCTTLNFTCLVGLTPDGVRYGFKREDGVYAGTFGPLVTIPAAAEFAANGHFQKWYSTPGLEFSHYVTAERLCVLVPANRHLPHSELFLKTLADLARLGLVAVYALVGLTILAARRLLLGSRRTDAGAVILDVYRLLLALPVSTAGRTRAENITLAAVFLGSFFLVNHFQGVLVTFTSAPMRHKTFDTIGELAASGLPIWSTSRDMYTLLGGPQSKLNLLLKTDKEMLAGYDKTDIGRLIRLNVIYDPSYTEYTGLKAKRPQRLVKECLATYFIAYLMPRGSPYARGLNTVISGLVSSGLYSLWLRGDGLSVPPLSREVIQFRKSERALDTVVTGDTAPLTTSDLSVAFGLLLYGGLLALLVCFIEMLIHKRSRNKLFASRRRKHRVAVKNKPAIEWTL